MRQLKFRVWDKKNNKFYQPTYRAYQGKLEDLVITMSGDLMMRTIDQPAIHESLFPERFEINQFTGLQDKYEEEIYEGDVILKITTGSLFEVYYSENAACFRVKRQDGWHFDLKEIFPVNDWKVVGNIYEKFNWNL